MIQDQLKVLIQLAVSDNMIADKEARLIHMIGQANGVSKDEIDGMIQNPEPIGSMENLTEDQKFEYLYNVIQLMKADGQVFKSEIAFCEQVAEKLGYDKAAVGVLSSRIYSDPSITADRDSLRAKVNKYLL